VSSSLLFGLPILDFRERAGEELRVFLQYTVKNVFRRYFRRIFLLLAVTRVPALHNGGASSKSSNHHKTFVKLETLTEK
jgi:hypothetical protein